MTYTPSDHRYEEMIYKRSGNTGLKLPLISLGLWHNFGGIDTYEKGADMIKTAFDAGITHLDLANNYGPPPGSAEEFMGQILKKELHGFRDELIISSKAGYRMWDGPYGDGGSRKYLLSSLDQSLKRMGLDYVDIFYHHRPDNETPIEESMRALHQAVVSGKALYAGISNYRPEAAKEAIAILKDLGTPCTIHQPNYNMFDRWIEDGLTEVLADNGVGAITFSPLYKGILTNKYLNGIPSDSRAASSSIFLNSKELTEDVIAKVRALNDIATNRNQSLAQMALAWNLRLPEVTSVLIGASKAYQITDSVNSIQNLSFDEAELTAIENILKES